jgi:zinc and cadmium transporter
MLVELFLSIFVISLVSLIGVITIGINHKKLESYLEFMVAFAIGALMGDVFVHLLPELAETGFSIEISLAILSGIIVFFILEKVVHWHHCHHIEHGETCTTYGQMVLIGDLLHNTIDGIILAGAFLSGNVIGYSTALAVFFHEIPQEIGDFGVLLKSGMSKKKALAYNFLTSLTAFVGAGFVLLFNSFIAGATPFFIAFAAGSFLYIAGTDLFPELHENYSSKKAILQVFFIILGIAAMLALTLLE